MSAATFRQVSQVWALPAPWVRSNVTLQRSVLGYSFKINSYLDIDESYASSEVLMVVTKNIIFSRGVTLWNSLET